MMDYLNKEAFELVNFVISKPIQIQRQPTERVGSKKEKTVVNLTDLIVGGMIARTTDYSGKTIEIFLEYEKIKYGFNKENYLRFKKLFVQLYESEYFNNKVSIKFVETELFKWIINVYREQKAISNIIDYLTFKADSIVKSYTFYFPVLNLDIEESFIIGNTEFSYFTKEYFDNYYKSLKIKGNTITESEFEKMYRNDFQAQVIAKVTVNAEYEKAKEIAKQDAEISVDVLKLYSDSVKLPESKTMFDLSHRLNYQVQSNFLSQNTIESEGLSINIEFKNTPFEFYKSTYELAYRCGLKVFSDYVSQRKKDELHELIIQSIHLFGAAISNWDLHLRCVNIITVLESILLKAEDEYKMEHKTKNRLSKILRDKQQERENIKNAFSNIYQVRHKMIHKAVRIELNSSELSEVQKHMVSLFLVLIEFNTIFGIKDKATLIAMLDEKP